MEISKSRLDQLKREELMYNRSKRSNTNYLNQLNNEIKSYEQELREAKQNETVGSYVYKVSHKHGIGASLSKAKFSTKLGFGREASRTGTDLSSNGLVYSKTMEGKLGKGISASTGYISKIHYDANDYKFLRAPDNLLKSTEANEYLRNPSNRYHYNRQKPMHERLVETRNALEHGKIMNGDDLLNYVSDGWEQHLKAHPKTASNDNQIDETSFRFEYNKLVPRNSIMRSRIMKRGGYEGADIYHNPQIMNETLSTPAARKTLTNLNHAYNMSYKKPSKRNTYTRDGIDELITNVKSHSVPSNGYDLDGHNLITYYYLMKQSYDRGLQKKEKHNGFQKPIGSYNTEVDNKKNKISDLKSEINTARKNDLNNDNNVVYMMSANKSSSLSFPGNSSISRSKTNEKSTNQYANDITKGYSANIGPTSIGGEIHREISHSTTLNLNRADMNVIQPPAPGFINRVDAYKHNMTNYPRMKGSSLKDQISDMRAGLRNNETLNGQGLRNYLNDTWKYHLSQLKDDHQLDNNSLSPEQFAMESQEQIPKNSLMNKMLSSRAFDTIYNDPNISAGTRSYANGLNNNSLDKGDSVSANQYQEIGSGDRVKEPSLGDDLFPHHDLKKYAKLLDNGTIKPIDKREHIDPPNMLNNNNDTITEQHGRVRSTEPSIDSIVNSDKNNHDIIHSTDNDHIQSYHEDAGDSGHGMDSHTPTEPDIGS